MAARVLCTLEIPEPFASLFADVADVEVLGHIPTTDELCAILRARPVDALCPQLRDPITAAVIDAAGPRLRGVCGMAVGYNNVDVPACTQRGVAVGNTPGVLTDATADLTLALILAVARRVVEGDHVMRAHAYPGWEPSYMLGLELRDATLGVVGFGRIGQAVARRALAFGMRVVHTPASGEIAADLRDRVTSCDFEELLATADVVTLHVPLNERTHHLINAATLRRMRPEAILVNTARGPVVDETALVAALRDGVIGGAGLDVFEDEPRMAPGLDALDNTVLLPHVGSATRRTRAAMAELSARNALAVIGGRLPEHCVNPDVAAAASWLGHPL